jgi:tRNA dimethylallyltransferase
MIPVITIEGPTASGKSSLAMQLAHELNTELISADSRQVYRKLDIGTAKPSKEEQAFVKHHLIDIIDIKDKYTAGDFKKQAGQLCSALWQRKKVPIIVGGTGLYVRSLLHGLFSIPDVPPEVKQEIRELHERNGLEFLHHFLAEVDPDSAARISVNDTQRILRALEVWKFTGITITDHWMKQDRTTQFTAFRILVSPERSELYSRIEKRLDMMMEKGILMEIDNLLKEGYQWSDPGLNAVGYKEFMPYFMKEDTWQNCLEKAKQHSRNYAKRQWTWYNKYSYDLVISPECIKLYEIIELVGQFLVNIVGLYTNQEEV